MKFEALPRGVLEILPNVEDVSRSITNCDFYLLFGPVDIHLTQANSFSVLEQLPVVLVQQTAFHHRLVQGELE